MALLTFLKDSSGNTESTYIWVHGDIYLSQSTPFKVPFLVFLALHIKMKRSGQVGPTPCYSHCKVVYPYQKFLPVIPCIFLAKLRFSA